MKTDFLFSTETRSITATVTNADIDNVALFETPAGSRVLSISLAVSDAFNTGAKLALGKIGTPAHLLAAQAIDTVGVFAPNLANPEHTTQPTTYIATVSDKTAAGSVDITMLFSMDTDTEL